jgi:predicted transcriptional regulator
MTTRKVNTNTFTFRLPDTLRNEVKEIADYENQHEGVLVRQAIEEMVYRFQQTAKKRKKQPLVWNESMFA